MSRKKEYQEITTYDIYFVDIKSIMNRKGISQNILNHCTQWGIIASCRILTIILAASQATNGSRRSCLKNLLRLVIEEDIDVFTPLSFRRGVLTDRTVLLLSGGDP